MNAIVSAMLVALLILGMHAQTAPYIDPVNRGSALVHLCRSVALPGAEKGRRDTVANSGPAAGCTAYISGFNEGTLESDTARMPFCVKQYATTRELVRVYETYMQENPQWLDYPKSVGVTLALQSAYPCPVADPNQSPEQDPDPDTDDDAEPKPAERSGSVHHAGQRLTPSVTPAKSPQNSRKAIVRKKHVGKAAER